MNTISSKTIDEIMKSLDEGVSKHVLIKRFPEHLFIIENILETKEALKLMAKKIPEPSNESLEFYLPKVERRVESPFITKLLSLNMKYKTILPVLVIGIAVVGGALLLSKKNISNPNTSNDLFSTETNDSASQNSDVNSETANDSGDINQNYSNPANVSSGASVDDITAGLASENVDMKAAASSDGISADSFASSDLSDFNQDNYDF